MAMAFTLLILAALTAWILGNPLILLVGLVLGAIVANRSTYRANARAIRREFD